MRLDAPGSREPTVIQGITRSGGEHCETSTLGVLLSAAGTELSEPMLFGLGAGLSFIYWDSKRQPMPFLGGRVRPYALTQQLAARLGIELDEHETSSPQRAWHAVRSHIDEGTPVGLQLDSHDLEYFSTPVHFAGHIVAMYGYDRDDARLVDTAQQGGHVRTSLESLARARAARGPMSARHRSFAVVSSTYPPERTLTALALDAMTACARPFLDPPIANLGNRGIRTAAKRLPSLLDRVADPARDLPAIATMMERAGTGGALFRNLYRDFLSEMHARVAGDTASTLARARDDFATAALRWTKVADLIAEAGRSASRTPLVDAARELQRIDELETRAMTSLVRLRR